jgi:molybdopterin biosynthesis enzyme
MSGGEPPLRRVRLGASFAALPALTWFAPVRYGDDGETVAPVAVNTSGDFTGLQGSVGIVEIPAGDTPYDAGSLVLFYPWGAP